MKTTERRLMARQSSHYLGIAALVAILLLPQQASAQATGRLQGRVTASETGEPLAGVQVYVQSTTRGTITNSSGAFQLDNIPAGERTAIFEFVGRSTVRRAIDIGAGGEVSLDVQMGIEALAIDNVVVSATREEQSLAQTAASVGIVQGSTIRETRPTHPSEIMGKIPGVWVNTTNGEGHMTAIRQPLTTDPVYLFLEDGVPTRSTGFFNHNALYEINLPQAERIEVIKGPTTALYGSDAIGGTINVETRPAVASPGLEATAEGGAFGFKRFLGSYGFTGGDNGVRADLNVTQTDGWRDGTAYDRESGTVRWDRVLGSNQTVKAIASFSRIDQQTAGTSRLSETAYEDTPTMNTTPVSFREVGAIRLSAEYARIGENSLLTVTPFARSNSMDILPNWSLTYDPAIWETSNRSVGFLAKYRYDFLPMDARIIVGADVDYSPGKHFETTVNPVRTNGIFTDYAVGSPIYDYDVTFYGVSPYLHAEASPLANLRLTGGLRFDQLGFDYENKLGLLETGSHRRPASTSVSYSEISPKLGAAYDFGATSIFASYSQGFRAPSEGQLFRQGVAINTVDLEPVEAVNYEAGLRGALGGRLSYQLSVYELRKTNDILSFQRPDDVQETQNAGETSHRGVEVGLGVGLPAGIRAETAFSYARHTYDDWQPNSGTDLSGQEMENAPRTLGNTTLSWAPSTSLPSLSLEWVHLSSYFLNAENTEKYDGHDVLNLNANWRVNPTVTVFGKLNNVTDQRYAEAAGYSAFRGREFAPGLPRTLYVGAQLSLRPGA